MNSVGVHGRTSPLQVLPVLTVLRLPQVDGILGLLGLSFTITFALKKNRFQKRIAGLTLTVLSTSTIGTIFRPVQTIRSSHGGRHPSRMAMRLVGTQHKVLRTHVRSITTGAVSPPSWPIRLLCD